MGTVHAKGFGSTERSLPKHEINYDECDTSESTDIDFIGVPARVEKIHIEGLARTKDDIVKDAVRDLFAASDFQDVLVKAHKVRLKLDSLGCFKNIAIFIDTAKGSKASPDGLEITYHVKEFRPLTGGVTTQVGNNEGSVTVGLRCPNIFGRGERFQVEYSYGSSKSNNFNVAFIKPFRGKRNPIFTASVFQANSEFPVSGFKELSRGTLLDIGFNSLPILKHNIQWEGCIRDLSVLSRNSAFDVREQAGLTLKSSLKHVLSVDVRDDLIFPSCGTLCQLTTELAGLGGDIGFVKNDLYLQYNYSILEDIVFQGTFGFGGMAGLTNDLKITMLDKFYLGGPLSVRGFQMRGIGKQSELNALGDLSYWACGLHLFTPLPFRPGKGGFGEFFRTHLFINLGNVADLKDIRETLLQQFKTNVRISYGIGVAIRLGHMARIEVNYCIPYAYDRSDRLQPGVQFGIGVQFL